MPRLTAQRIAGFGTSIFTEISAAAARHGAINLGQGFPDFPAPAFVKAAAARAIAADANQYAPAPGLPRLRRAIAARFAERHGVAVDPDTQVTVTSGATEALFDAVMALVDPGDEVVVFEPTYDAYVPDILMAGGRPRAVTLRAPDFTFDPVDLETAFTPRTRLVIVNSPHNPTGKVFGADELDRIARLCVRHDVIALCDEVHSEILFDGARHVSLYSRPGMAGRTIVADSVGKAFSVTGWKIGWAIAAPALAAALRNAHQWVTFASATPLQEAAADALEGAANHAYWDELRRAYAARRDLLRGLLAAAGLPPLPVAGAYFMLADLARLPFADDVAFCRHLVEKVGVAAIPVSPFYSDPAAAPKLARFCFAKRDETLREGGRRLAAASWTP